MKMSLRTPWTSWEFAYLREVQWLPHGALYMRYDTQIFVAARVLSGSGLVLDGVSSRALHVDGDPHHSRRNHTAQLPSLNNAA